jgi:hypothetical protein
MAARGEGRRMIYWNKATIISLAIFGTIAAILLGWDDALAWIMQWGWWGW